MIRTLLLSVFVLVFGLCPVALTAPRGLELKNQFSTAEAVLNYFLERDADGFIWSGLLDQERREFTNWKASPARDSFYLARGFQITSDLKSSSPLRSVMAVHYDIESVRDSAGTRVPVEKKLQVRFVLEKQKGQWKIVEPDAEHFTPVLLSSRVKEYFP
ncbi:MAG: hypothetical protein RJB38_964 [Pseudomonadota bacterium]|jgi:hypothetical protein